MIVLVPAGQQAFVQDRRAMLISHDVVGSLRLPTDKLSQYKSELLHEQDQPESKLKPANGGSGAVGPASMPPVRRRLSASADSSGVVA